MAAQRSQASTPLEERNASSWLVVTRRLHTEAAFATTGKCRFVKERPFVEILFPRKFQDIFRTLIFMKCFFFF